MTTIVYYPDTSRRRIIPIAEGIEPTPIILPRMGITVLPAVRSDMEPASNPPRGFPFGYVEAYDGVRICLSRVPMKNAENQATDVSERLQTVCKNFEGGSREVLAEVSLLMEHAQIARKLRYGHPAPGEQETIRKAKQELASLWSEPGDLYRENLILEKQKIKALETAIAIGYNKEKYWKRPTFQRCLVVEELIRSGKTWARTGPLEDVVVKRELDMWLQLNRWGVDEFQKERDRLGVTLDDAYNAGESIGKSLAAIDKSIEGLVYWDDGLQSFYTIVDGKHVPIGSLKIGNLKVDGKENTIGLEECPEAIKITGPCNID